MFVHKDFRRLGRNIVLPNSLDHSHAFSLCSLSSQSPEYYIDVSINNPMICDANADLGYKDNMFNMLGGILMIMCP